MKRHPTIYGPALHRHARKYKEEFLRRFLGKPRQRVLRQSRRWPSIAAWDAADSNVVGIGYGLKQFKGRPTKIHALRIYVRKKLPLSKIPAAQRIPSHINGLPTDVIKVGQFRFAVQGGSPGQNPGTNPGTLGSLVAGANPTNRYILSCLHVLAADPFAPVCHTATQTGETMETLPDGRPIAELWYAMKMAASGNIVDCAIARLFNVADFEPIIRGIGPQVGTPMQAYLPQKPGDPYQEVIKSGAMSGVTRGLVISLTEDQQIPAGAGTVGFVRQIGICGFNGQPFAEPGDSGSLVLDAATQQPVALVFAVDKTSGITLANPIQNVLDALKIHFV